MPLRPGRASAHVADVGAGGRPLSASPTAAGMRVLLLAASGTHENDIHPVPPFHRGAPEGPVQRWDYFVCRYAEELPGNLPPAALLKFPSSIAARCRDDSRHGCDDRLPTCLADPEPGIQGYRSLKAALFAAQDALADSLGGRCRRRQGSASPATPVTGG
jgi:hypothetical protein